MLHDTVRRGIELGTLRKDVSPVQLYITIASLCFFYVSNMYTLSALFERDLDCAEARQERRQHVADVVLSYLGVVTPASASDQR